MIDNDIKELNDICRPVVEYLKNKHPHHTITITSDFINLNESVIGIPVDSQVCELLETTNDVLKTTAQSESGNENHMTQGGTLGLIDSAELQQRVLDCINSDEINKFWNGSIFNGDEKYRQAITHGMLLASMMTSQCENIIIDIKKESEEHTNEK